MRTKKDGEFRSSVYTQRPPYADFDAKPEELPGQMEWEDVL